MNSNLGKIILGSLIMAPHFLELADLREKDFSVDRERKLFKLISQFWEESRPVEIDCSLLAERLGGDGAFSFIGSLTAGLQHLLPEIFLAHVSEFKKKRIVANVLHRIEKMAKSGELDLDEIRPDLDEYDDLSRAKVNVISLDQVAPKDVCWLWPGRIPLGMFTLLAGIPGCGKSFLSVVLASKLSRGEALPDSQGIIFKCSSLFLAAEDSISQAIRPRADANNADPSKIFILDEQDSESEIDIQRLTRLIKENTEIKLLVIDPLNSFLKSGTDYFRDPDVRRTLLQPLSRFAEESGIAVLAIVHFNKQVEGEAVHRIGGSVAYGAVARSVLAIARDDEDPERRLLMPVKISYAKKPPALAFKIGLDLKLIFEDEPLPEIDAEDVLSKQKRFDSEERSFAAEWLQDLLQPGQMDLKEIFKAAQKNGISRSTLFRMAKRLRLVSKTSGFGQFKTSAWGLPS